MAELRTYLHVTVSNAIGRLAQATGKLKDAGVNLSTIIAWGEGPTGHLILGPDDADAARRALGGWASDIDEIGVVVVEVSNEVGALERIASQLAGADIEISMVAATTAGGAAAVVLSTNDNMRAADLLT
jgi:hypothetical protein